MGKESMCESDLPSNNYFNDQFADWQSQQGDERGQCICAACATRDPRVNFILFITCYLGFMILGSCLLSTIERDHEVHLKNQLHLQQEEFLKKYPHVDRTKFLNDLNGLIGNITRLQTKGINWEPITANRSWKSCYDGSAQQESQDEFVPGGESPPKRSCNWDFSSSLLFMTSLVTTIGYGHVAPLTQVGKLMTIILSAIGIPFTLTLLSNTGSILFSNLASYIETCFAVIVSRIHSNASVFVIRLVNLFFVTLFLSCCCFFIPAYFFHLFEPEWSYFDAIYFSYISLTTIGLGDFIPAFGMSDISLYRLLTIGYLYVGLTLIMLWLALIYRIPQLNIGHLFQSKEGSCGSCEENQNQLENVGILKHNCSSNTVIEATPSTSRSSLSKTYGTQNELATP